jgi:hypothetical protein
MTPSTGDVLCVSSMPATLLLLSANGKVRHTHNKQAFTITPSIQCPLTQHASTKSPPAFACVPRCFQLVQSHTCSNAVDGSNTIITAAAAAAAADVLAVGTSSGSVLLFDR